MEGDINLWFQCILRQECSLMLGIDTHTCSFSYTHIFYSLIQISPFLSLTRCCRRCCSDSRFSWFLILDSRSATSKRKHMYIRGGICDIWSTYLLSSTNFIYGILCFLLIVDSYPRPVALLSASILHSSFHSCVVFSPSIGCHISTQPSLNTKFKGQRGREKENWKDEEENSWRRRRKKPWKRRYSLVMYAQAPSKATSSVRYSQFRNNEMSIRGLLFDPRKSTRHPLGLSGWGYNKYELVQCSQIQKIGKRARTRRNRGGVISWASIATRAATYSSAITRDWLGMQKDSTEACFQHCFEPAAHVWGFSGSIVILLRLLWEWREGP